ncbi:MAG: hypothetical protein OEZ36_06995 [Spirochaetota bacterium]|nr:hypothetical protein [Spirochaetota bacterium]
MCQMDLRIDQAFSVCDSKESKHFERIGTRNRQISLAKLKL